MENDEVDIWAQKTLLKGNRISLQPLELDHLDGLSRLLLSPNSWHVVHWGIKNREDLKEAIIKSQVSRLSGTGNTFAMVLNEDGQAVGMSRLFNFNRQHKNLEIGGTWISESWQKTYGNSEAKLLMLAYAFETIKCQRVELRADAFNFNSQRAILRLGAKYEGELRQSCLLPDGRKRDYKIYSILDSEWQNVKAHLNWQMEKFHV